MPPWKAFIDTTLTMLPRPAVPEQPVGERLGEEERRRQVQADDVVPVLGRGLRRRRPPDHARVVDQHADVLEAAPAPGHQVRGGVRRQGPEVQLPGRAADPAIRDGLADRVERLDVDGDDVRAGLGERERHRVAEAARGSGDHRTLAAQREEAQDPIAHRMSESRYSGSTPADS